MLKTENTVLNFLKNERRWKMSVAIDIILLALAVFIIVRYTIKGFLKSIFDSFKVILSIFLAFLLRVPCRTLLSSLFLRGWMVNLVNSSLISALEGSGGGFNVLQLYATSPSFFNNVLAKYGLDAELAEADFEALLSGDQSVVGSLSENIGGALATLVGTILALVIMFIVSLIVLTIVIKLLDSLTQFEGIKTVNRVLGLILGIVVAFLILWGICVVLEALAALLGPVAPDFITQEKLNDSMIISMLRKINVLDWVSIAINRGN